MDRSKVEQIISEHVGPMKRFLDLAEWDVTVTFKAMEERTCAECAARIDYKLAKINIDPAQMEGLDEVIDTLFHEMCHLVLWPFDLYRETIFQLVPDGEDKNSPNSRVESRAWTHAVEQGVFRLERIWRHFGVRDLYLDLFTSPSAKG